MKKLDSLINNLSMRAKVDYSLKQAPPRKDRTNKGMEFVVHEGFRFCLKKTADGGIYGVNPDYAFAIHKSLVNESYSVLMVSKIGSSQDDDRLVEREIEGIKSFLLNACSVHDIPLPQLALDADVKIKTILPYEKEGKNYSRIELNSFYNEKGDVSYSDDYIICDPAKNWAIVGWEYKNHSLDAVLRGEYECRLLGQTEFPVTVKFQHGFVNDNGEAGTAAYGSLTVLNDQPITKEEFYLSYYGLPEPNFETKLEAVVKDIAREGKLPTWLWYFLIGLTCIGVGYWIKRRWIVS